MNIKAAVKLFLSALLALSATHSANGQAKWWWEKYPTATNKVLELRNSSGGSVNAALNSTGGSPAPGENTATQPPTVIIQQTATTTQTGNGMTCVTPSFGAGTSSSYGAYFYASSCPSVPGYNVTPIMATPAGIQYTVNSIVAACCYVKVNDSTSTAIGGGSFDPWSSNGAQGGGVGTQSFKTPGGTFWTVPTGVYRIWISMVGGGGGGAGYTTGPGGGGGSGGMTYRLPVTVFPGDTVSIVVGGGGHGSTSGGGAGGLTSVLVGGKTLSAGGGGQGSSYASCAGNGHSVGTLTQGGFGGTYSCSPSHSSPPLTNGGGSTNGAVGGVHHYFGYYAYYQQGTYYSTSAGSISNPNPAPLPLNTWLGSSIGGSGAWGNSMSNGGPGFMGIRSDPSTATSRGADGSGANQSNFTGLGGKGFGAGGGGAAVSGGTGGKGADGAVWIEW